MARAAPDVSFAHPRRGSRVICPRASTRFRAAAGFGNEAARADPRKISHLPAAPRGRRLRHARCYLLYARRRVRSGRRSRGNVSRGPAAQASPSGERRRRFVVGLGPAPAGRDLPRNAAVPRGRACRGVGGRRNRKPGCRGTAGWFRPFAAGGRQRGQGPPAATNHEEGRPGFPCSSPDGTSAASSRSFLAGLPSRG